MDEISFMEMTEDQIASLLIDLDKSKINLCDRAYETIKEHEFFKSNNGTKIAFSEILYEATDPEKTRALLIFIVYRDFDKEKDMRNGFKVCYENDVPFGSYILDEEFNIVMVMKKNNSYDKYFLARNFVK